MAVVPVKNICLVMVSAFNLMIVPKRKPGFVMVTVRRGPNLATTYAIKKNGNLIATMNVKRKRLLPFVMENVTTFLNRAMVTVNMGGT